MFYIMPMPPAPPAGIAGTSSLMFATTDSVVSSVDATEVAFCSAVLVTFTGSRIPCSTISTYLGGSVKTDSGLGLFYLVDDHRTL